MFYDLALIRYTFAFTLCFLFKISFRNRQVDLPLDLACSILAYLLFMVHSPSAILINVALTDYRIGLRSFLVTSLIERL